MSAPHSLQSAARALGGEVTAGQILAPGPGHSREDRSLSVKLDPNAPDGFVVNSFGRSDPLACRDHVRDRLGLEPWRPQPAATNTQAGSKPRVVAEYVYEHADGTPYLKVLRTEPKGFPQRHWTGSGWAVGKPHGPKIPYRLPELQLATHNTVFIAEGEKDADRLANLGFIATTASEGAGKWSSDLNEHFRRRCVYILADNDLAGRKHARQVAENLLGVADEVRIVHLPGLPEKGDVSDWLDAGGNPDELEAICQRFPAYERREEVPDAEEEIPFEVEPALPPISAAPFVWSDPSKLPRRQWIYGEHFIRKFVSVTVAPGGVGKSSLEMVEALAMASGRALLGAPPMGRFKVWYWCGEDPMDELQRRVMAAAMHHEVIEQDLAGHLFVNSGRTTPIVVAEQTRSGITIAAPVVEAVKRTIHENGIDVVIIDPFVSSHRVTENDNNAIDAVAKLWAQIADETSCAVELVHHVRKTGGTEITVEDGRGASALLAAARSARTLNPMTSEEAERAGVEKRRQYFRVDNGKSNMAPPPDKSTWCQLASVDLGNGISQGSDPFDLSVSPSDHVGVVTTWEWPNPLDAVNSAHELRKAQAAVNAGGPWRENVQSPEWVGYPIAEALGLVPGADGKLSAKDRATVRGVLAIWIANGMFEVFEDLDEKSKPRKYVRVGDAAAD